METKNAIIEGTMLGYEDHRILTCYLYLNYGGSGQGFGGYALDRYDQDKKIRVGTGWGMGFVMQILKTLEVDSWEKIKGTHCRVVADHSQVYKIGHIIKDKWFDPKNLELPRYEQ